MSQRRPVPISMLDVEEQFDSEDDRFVDTLRNVHSWKQLRPFAQRWKNDHRTWARRQIFRYLEEPLDRLGHQPVVKQWFKHAEATGDDELMARFLVVFDGVVRYRRSMRTHYDWNSGRTWREEQLRLPRNVAPLNRTVSLRDPFTGKTHEQSTWTRPDDRLFSHRTRFYLRRRAWRYFRRMGYQRPAEYCAAIAGALAQYRDDDLQRGEDILESWGLMQACFGKSERLQRSTSHLWLEDGVTFGDLEPSPYFPDLWRTESAFATLLSLLPRASSRLVRTWVAQLLETAHEDQLGVVELKLLLPLLDHTDEAVCEFAARQLSRSTHLASLPLDSWFGLLETRNGAALELICRAMVEHVRPERLSLADCIRLACAAPSSVSRMGIDWLKQRRIESDEDRRTLATCAHAKCVATARELADWTLAQVGTPEHYDREQASALLDSLNAGCRAAAWEWLQRKDCPGQDDSVLWSRLTESPHDDIRLPLVRALQQRSGAMGPSDDDLTPVWSAVLAGVHRGGREKLQAIRQLRDAVLRQPDRLESLLPVLCVAVRSIRGPERAAGLSALVEIVDARPELEPAVRAAMPELQLDAEAV